MDGEISPPIGELFSTMGESVPHLKLRSDLRLVESVVLIGMMGSGKTAIGRTLSARLGVEMCNSDAEIVASAKLSIAEIFDRYGEPFFRDKEGRIIARLLDAPPCILSTGGGAWLTEGNRTLLLDNACVVWLEADLDLLWSRVRHKSHRPLLQTNDPKATLAALLRTRTPSYELAPWKVSVQPDWSIDATADRVMDILITAQAVLPNGASA